MAGALKISGQADYLDDKSENYKTARVAYRWIRTIRIVSVPNSLLNAGEFVDHVKADSSSATHFVTSCTYAAAANMVFEMKVRYVGCGNA